MSGRIPAFVLLLTALLVASCSSPMATSPGPHDCLAYWGANADLLVADLNAQRLAHGPGWGHRLQDPATYDALKSLEQKLADALGVQVNPLPPDVPGTIPQTPPLDVVRNLADLVRQDDPNGAGLEHDGNCGSHPMFPGQGWLQTVGPGPTPPPVLVKANQLLTALKDALDM